MSSTAGAAPLGGACSLDDLAADTGEDPERLLEWQALGFIGSGEAGSFTAEDVGRARLVQLCLRRGFDLDAVAQAERENGTLTRAVHSAFESDAGERTSIDDAARELDLQPEFVRRLWVSMGGNPDERLAAADIDGLRLLATFHSLGLPDEALIEGARVFTDCLSRVAEMESRIFHIHIHERLKASGLSGMDLLEATTGLADQMRPMLEPSIMYFHAKGWERAVVQDMLEHLAEDLGAAPPAEQPGELQRAVVFTDLSGFTPLTALNGDLEAANVLERFSELVRRVVSRHDGRVVKQIGDAFLLVFAEADDAVRCALAIRESASQLAEFPPVRTGINSGSVLYGEGDYVGSTVNVASRVAGKAAQSQVLVTDNVRRAAAEADDLAFINIGPQELKGIDEDVDLFEADLKGQSRPSDSNSVDLG